MAGIRAVLYDLDGVLVDVSGSYRRAIAETVEHFTGHPPETGAVQRLKDAGGYNDDWAVTAALVERSGVVVPFEEIVDEFNRRYRGTAWNGLIARETPLADALDLERLRAAVGIVGLVTGRPRVEAAFTLERFGWADHFDVVVTMDDSGGRGKPDPYPLLLALKRLRDSGRPVPAGRVIYVGDSVDDMRAARAAGCPAIGFVPPYLDPVRHGEVLRAAGASGIVSDHGAVTEAVSRVAAASD